MNFDHGGEKEPQAFFYCMMVGRKIILLHSFIKKTNETPKREFEIARRRQREVSGS